MVAPRWPLVGDCPLGSRDAGPRRHVQAYPQVNGLLILVP